MGAYNAGRIWGAFTLALAASFMNTFLLAYFCPGTLVQG